MRIQVETGAALEIAGAQAGQEITLDARDDLAAILRRLDRLSAIRIRAGAFGDGSVFSQARLLRRLGFSGRLCAAGPLIPDQLHMARGAGFDEIEPDAEILARHDDAAWRRAADRYRTTYLARLKGPACLTERTNQNA
ncbi:MAG: DUF934 domain-containing protein [Alphaproteobacteria bacterium]|nr:DUF934 domain-containing protein [Alphaproteobacteria bacterium]